jgi:hypothetical protein
LLSKPCYQTQDTSSINDLLHFGASIAAAQPSDPTPSGGAHNATQESPASLPTNEMRPIEVKIISTEFKFMPAKQHRNEHGDGCQLSPTQCP